MRSRMILANIFVKEGSTSVPPLLPHTKRMPRSGILKAIPLFRSFEKVSDFQHLRISANNNSTENAGKKSRLSNPALLHLGELTAAITSMELHQLPIVVDEKPTINIPNRTIERLTVACKFFHNTSCGCEIVAICDNFPANTTLNISFYSTVTTLYLVALISARSQQESFQFLTFIDPPLCFQSVRSCNVPLRCNIAENFIHTRDKGIDGGPVTFAQARKLSHCWRIASSRTRLVCNLGGRRSVPCEEKV